MEIVHGMVQTQKWKMGGVILTVKNDLVSEYVQLLYYYLLVCNHTTSVKDMTKFAISFPSEKRHALRSLLWQPRNFIDSIKA